MLNWKHINWIACKKLRKAVFPLQGLVQGFTGNKSHAQRVVAYHRQALIQYAVEEAIAAGIDTLIFVTGRNKRAIEDHFDNKSN